MGLRSRRILIKRNESLPFPSKRPINPTEKSAEKINCGEKLETARLQRVAHPKKKPFTDRQIVAPVVIVSVRSDDVASCPRGNQRHSKNESQSRRERERKISAASI